MAKAHTMTPARRAALKKAQAASARKRRGKGKGKLAVANRKITKYQRVKRRGNIARGVAAAAIVGSVSYGAYVNHSIAKSSKEQTKKHNDYARSARSKVFYGPYKPPPPRRVPSTRGPGRPLHSQRALTR